MGAVPYSDVLEYVRNLDPDEQRQLLTELATLVERGNVDAGERAPRSILELDGLGKEIWTGIDPDQYLEAERRSWDG